jgi:N-acetylglucosamine malate deacetylase 1
MLNQQKILIVTAHPDDEVLGCGASMVKWGKEGHEVNVLILAEGATSRDKQRDRASRSDDLSLLAKSAKQANDILGVQSLYLMDYPDNRMDSVDLLDLIKTVEEIITKLKPDIVLTHHSSDLNIDHQITHQAVITACRPYPNQSATRILLFEIPSSTEWQSPSSGNPFVPNWFEDISDILNLKIKALEAYKSEMLEWPHARSIKALGKMAWVISGS